MNISLNNLSVFVELEQNKCVKGHITMGNCGSGMSFLLKNIYGGAMLWKSV